MASAPVTSPQAVHMIVFCCNRGTLGHFPTMKQWFNFLLFTDLDHAKGLHYHCQSAFVTALRISHKSRAGNSELKSYHWPVGSSASVTSVPFFTILRKLCWNYNFQVIWLTLGNIHLKQVCIINILGYMSMITNVYFWVFLHKVQCLQKERIWVCLFAHQTLQFVSLW